MDAEVRKGKDVVQCTVSLMQAIQEAGGTVSERLLDMTVQEFIEEVAGPNGIRFVFKRDDE